MQQTFFTKPNKNTGSGQDELLNNYCLPENDFLFSKTDYLAQNISDNLLKVIKQDLENDNSFFLRIRDGFVRQIAQKIVNNPNKTIIIGVTGESGSGKTTLAEKVLKACLEDTTKDIYTLITSDDYYHDSSEKLIEAGSYEALFASGYSFDCPDAVNIDLMKEHIKLLSEGKSILSPEYDFAGSKSTPDKKLKTPAKVILTEGIFALNENLRDILDIAIYIQTPFHVIKDRWYKRAGLRGKTGKAADMQFYDVNNQAEKHIRPTKYTADIVVSGLISSEYIEFLAEQIINSIKNSINESMIKFISQPKETVSNSYDKI